MHGRRPPGKEPAVFEPLAIPAYVSVANGSTLAELDRLPDDGPVLLSLAVRFGPTRLIDNEPLP